MKDTVITSLRSIFSTFPIPGFWRYPIGTGEITLQKSQLAFRYVTPLGYKKSRTLNYADIGSYFRPFPTILYLDHHSDNCPKIVKIGDLLKDKTRIADVDTIVKALESHHIPARQESNASGGVAGQPLTKSVVILLSIFAACLVIGAIIVIWVMVATS